MHEDEDPLPAGQGAVHRVPTELDLPLLSRDDTTWKEFQGSDSIADSALTGGCTTRYVDDCPDYCTSNKVLRGLTCLNDGNQYWLRCEYNFTCDGSRRPIVRLCLLVRHHTFECVLYNIVFEQYKQTVVVVVLLCWSL